MIRNILTGLVIILMLVIALFLVFVMANFLQGWFIVLAGIAILLIIANFLGDMYNSGDL